MSELNLSHDPAADEVSGERNSAARFQEGAPLKHVIDNWQTKRKEDTHRRVAAASAAVSRQKYRMEREAQGKTVRLYVRHEHDTQQLGETHEEYSKRLHRDRARLRRGVNADTVRPWTDLSSLTEAEKAVHRRQLAKERKARQRQLPSGATCIDGTELPESIFVDDIEWGMF